MNASPTERVTVRLPRSLWAAADACLDAACAPIDRASAATQPVDVAEAVRVGTVIEIQPDHRGRTTLVIEALPAQLNPSVIMEALADQVRDGELGGISDLGDHSEASETKLLITVRRDADAATVLDQVLSSIAAQCGPIHERALAIRDSARAQVQSSDHPASNADPVVSVALSREQWNFVQLEIERALPEHTWDRPPATNTTWQAGYTIGEQL